MSTVSPRGSNVQKDLDFLYQVAKDKTWVASKDAVFNVNNLHQKYKNANVTTGSTQTTSAVQGQQSPRNTNSAVPSIATPPSTPRPGQQPPPVNTNLPASNSQATPKTSQPVAATSPKGVSFNVSSQPFTPVTSPAPAPTSQANPVKATPKNSAALNAQSSTTAVKPTTNNSTTPNPATSQSPGANLGQPLKRKATIMNPTGGSQTKTPANQSTPAAFKAVAKRSAAPVSQANAPPTQRSSVPHRAVSPAKSQNNNLQQQPVGVGSYNPRQSNIVNNNARRSAQPPPQSQTTQTPPGNN